MTAFDMHFSSTTLPSLCLNFLFHIGILYIIVKIKSNTIPVIVVFICCQILNFRYNRKGEPKVTDRISGQLQPKDKGDS
ncbi:hypothetical protein K030075H31_31720 [Blautia producta]